MADEQPRLSAVGRILSRLPGIRRYYSTMSALDDDRRRGWARVSALEAALVQFQQEADTARADLAREAGREEEVRRLEEEQDGLKAILLALECEKAVLLQVLQGQDGATLAGVTARLGGVEQGLAALRLATEQAMAAPAHPAVPVTLYLDLLEAALTGVLEEDGAISPWSKPGFDPKARAYGRDWPARATTMIGTARMRNLRLLLERALSEAVPGDFIETGVWRGGACIYARGILAAHGDTTRRVWVADSFRGLPPPDEAAFPADAGDRHSTVAELAVSRLEVEANFARYRLLDTRVVFLEGWFRDTLPIAPIERLAVLRLDGDMYGSTMETLEALYAKVSPGGFVIVDDYLLAPCAQAVNDYRERHGITAPLHEVDGAAVWWRVPR